ncbi:MULTISPECIES: AraC family transcriptional regulator [unclassified Pseudoclavibacter]|uniref:AraC family transcriptional regulator n=1 Tax=unclassified Pseudoclavibacter TaxID=2615177 RepID=UPI001BA71579|nr:AraC family transcriptional regulator [Pseudoclavibacter sp. Marseille-Q4354]MBS3178069.1 AraC family transcriptional regulator [Pseudoclavibacter sp. Marseille-Q4354]
MISTLNHLVQHIEAHLGDSIDVASLASSLGTTEYHARRMFSSLAGMPLSEYIRRRRMTVAAGDVLGDDELLEIATQFGYGSTEAFGRAFRAVHGSTPGEVRRAGGPLRSQPQLRFRLTVEGNSPMDTRIIEHPAFQLIGHAARVPLIHNGVNPHIQAHIAAIPAEAHARLKALSSGEPTGLLQVSADVDPDYTEGTPLTYLHGVAVGHDHAVPDDLDVIGVPAGTWAVFTATGDYPAALQQLWAATATDWFPSNPWRLRPGPSIVAIIDRSPDFSTATCELWLPVERS